MQTTDQPEKLQPVNSKECESAIQELLGYLTETERIEQEHATQVEREKKKREEQRKKWRDNMVPNGEADPKAQPEEKKEETKKEDDKQKEEPESEEKEKEEETKEPAADKPKERKKKKKEEYTEDPIDVDDPFGEAGPSFDEGPSFGEESPFDDTKGPDDSNKEEESSSDDSPDGFPDDDEIDKEQKKAEERVRERWPVPAPKPPEPVPYKPTFHYREYDPAMPTIGMDTAKIALRALQQIKAEAAGSRPVLMVFLCDNGERKILKFKNKKAALAYIEQDKKRFMDHIDPKDTQKEVFKDDNTIPPEQQRYKPTPSNELDEDGTFKRQSEIDHTCHVFQDDNKCIVYFEKQQVTGRWDLFDMNEAAVGDPDPADIPFAYAVTNETLEKLRKEQTGEEPEEKPSEKPENSPKDEPKDHSNNESNKAGKQKKKSKFRFW